MHHTKPEEHEAWRGLQVPAVVIQLLKSRGRWRRLHEIHLISNSNIRGMSCNTADTLMRRTPDNASRQYAMVNNLAAAFHYIIVVFSVSPKKSSASTGCGPGV